MISRKIFQPNGLLNSKMDNFMLESVNLSNLFRMSVVVYGALMKKWKWLHECEEKFHIINLIWIHLLISKSQTLRTWKWMVHPMFKFTTKFVNFHNGSGNQDKNIHKTFLTMYFVQRVLRCLLFEWSTWCWI